MGGLREKVRPDLGARGHFDVGIANSLNLDSFCFANIALLITERARRRGSRSTLPRLAVERRFSKLPLQRKRPRSVAGLLQTLALPKQAATNGRGRTATTPSTLRSPRPPRTLPGSPQREAGKSILLNSMPAKMRTHTSSWFI